MPIRPENRKRYGKEWKQIRAAILERAGNRCEGSPHFPDCRVANHSRHPETGSRVVLTIAHMSPPIEDTRPENLRAWCQRCHNKYDAKNRAAGIKDRRWKAVGQDRLDLYAD